MFTLARSAVQSSTAHCAVLAHVRLTRLDEHATMTPMRPLLCGGLCLLAACASGPAELTDHHRQAVTQALTARQLSAPDQLELRGGFVVATYRVPKLTASARTFAETRLLAIREALLPFGFTDYRVDVNGASPGTGLVRRYGSARFIDGGTLEWLQP